MSLSRALPKLTKRCLKGSEAKVEYPVYSQQAVPLSDKTECFENRHSGWKWGNIYSKRTCHSWKRYINFHLESMEEWNPAGENVFLHPCNPAYEVLDRSKSFFDGKDLLRGWNGSLYTARTGSNHRDILIARCFACLIYLASSSRFIDLYLRFIYLQSAVGKG